MFHLPCTYLPPRAHHNHTLGNLRDFCAKKELIALSKATMLRAAAGRGMAAQSSLVPVAPAAASTPLAAAAVKRAKNATLAMQMRADAPRADDDHGSRRDLVLRGLAAVGMGSLAVAAAPEGASAAKRRPPPPPATGPEEKKDPNVSGVLAKVLASKKRKEAMKEAVAKLREKGNAVSVN